MALSFVGQHRRYAGLLSYLSYLAIFLVAVRLYASAQLSGLVRAFLLALAGIVGYGWLQVAGLDPFTWSSGGLAQRFSTMGNINFAAGYVGAVLPMAVAVAAFTGTARSWRVGAAILALVSIGYLGVNGSSQGPLAAVAGLLVVAVSWFLARRRAQGPRTETPLRPSPLVLAGGGVVLAVLVLLSTRLLPELAQGLSERRYFWRAALAITGDNPLVGTGLDSFRDWFPRYRAPEHAVLVGFDSADSAHSLPLSMLASGGIILLLAYLAFVGATAYVLVRGLRTAPPERMALFAGFGGLWVAYQVQSFVSVDVPGVTLLQFVSAGVIWALAAPPRTLTVGLPLASAKRNGWLPRSGAGAQRAAAASLALLLVISLAGAWFSTRPLRAELAAAQARAEPEPSARVVALERAIHLAPYEGEYQILVGQARVDAGDQAGARAAVIRSAELRPGSSRLALGAADFSRSNGDTDAAQRWVEQAIDRDPNNPELLDEVAALYRGQDRLPEAEALTAEAERLRVEHSDS